MIIQVDKQLLRNQQYDEALRQACDALSAHGVQNYIHWDWDNNNQHRVTLVELIGQPGLFLPVINHHNNSLELRERDL